MTDAIAGCQAQPLEVLATPMGREFTRTFPGKPEEVRRARTFLRGVLPEGDGTDDALLAASELMANAISHSRSKEPGGSFTIRVILRQDQHILIEVEDQGGLWDFCALGAEHGRGLTIVAGLAGDPNWGVESNEATRTVWVRFPWPTPAAPEPSGNGPAALVIRLTPVPPPAQTAAPDA
jgi:anti-sigma regulatory factor (Ser/Thr protein kinase)